MSRGGRQGGDNVPSELLGEQENLRIFEVLGRKCVTLVTAVVQLVVAEPGGVPGGVPGGPGGVPGGSWSLRGCGVACLVRDSPRRSYFIRIFRLPAGELWWEQELQGGMGYKTPTPFFHTFVSHEGWAGLNFASEAEAATFEGRVQERLRRRQQRAEKQPLPPPPPPGHERRGSLPRTPNPEGPPIPAVPIPNPDITPSRYRGLPSPGEHKKGGRGRKKISKADIGVPSGFKHVSHVGWDPSGGFDLAALDPALRSLFAQAGVSERHLADAETSRLIHDFIERQGGLQAVREEMGRQGPPPPPPGRGSPAPPPPRPSPLLRPLPLGAPGPSPTPRRPRPSPGPAPSARPRPSPARLRPLRSGRSSPSPSSAAPSPLRGRPPRDPPGPGGAAGPDPPGGDAQQGGDPKNGGTPETPEVGAGPGAGGLVGALMDVMQKRSRVIHSSDEGTASEEEEDDDEWDD
ncbi:actin nucleation-promoting factor WAS-like [Agelaius phoeniceus]|uniref:actin nucleation-promoting factor WAS-like n=1 Tax=Agelaius phoeniceus TaxID=39638 RepID=UPI0040549FB3